MRFIPVFVFLLFAWAAAPSFGQSRYDNPKYGFSLVPPEKWTRVPLMPTEKWIVARFKSDKEYAGEEEWMTHCPVMKVILFSKQAPKVEGGNQDLPEELREILASLEGMRNPFKTYKDYLKGNFAEGGYFVSREESGAMNGIPVVQMEIKVEKLARSGKQRIITWIFAGDIGEFAVETPLPEGQYNKLAPLVFNALKSFRLIPRVRGATDDAEESAPAVRRGPRTPEEEKKRRIALAEKLCAKARSDLPPGWKAFDKGNFLIVYHTPDSKAQRYAAQADAFWTWLDRNFGRVGTDHCARCILRICKDWDEEKIYRSGSADAYSFENREITTNVNSEDRRFEFEYINTRILHRYLCDKNERLWDGLPVWLEKGLDQYLGTAIAKGGRLVFEPDKWEEEYLDLGRKKGVHRPLKDLVRTTAQDVGGDRESGYMFIAQCGSLVRYFFGPGNRGMTKDVVFTYLGNLVEVLKEKDKEELETFKKMIASSDREMTEEEEEEEYRKRRAGQGAFDWEGKKKDILERTFAKTFGKWDDRHWAVLDQSWKAFAK